MLAPEIARPHWLRADELGRLADAVPPLCRPVVPCLGLSGLRFSEMAALIVDDVIETPYGLGLRVHRAAPQSKRTSEAIIGSTRTHQTHTVPVPAALGRYVVGRVASARPGEHLFPTPTGGIWTNTDFRVRSRWTAVTAAVGLAGTAIYDTQQRRCSSPQVRTSRPSRSSSGMPRRR